MITTTSVGRECQIRMPSSAPPLSVECRGEGYVSYQTAFSAGADVCAQMAWNLSPGEHIMIPTGIFITDHNPVTCPPGMIPEIQIRPRSGLAAKYGITLLNFGTIDADYRGEIHVILQNFGKSRYTVNLGDRIAQMVGAWTFRIGGVPVKDAERGTGGFGSTGI